MAAVGKRGIRVGVLACLLLSLYALGTMGQPQAQDIPDAPSTAKPPQSFPSPTVPNRPTPPGPEQAPTESTTAPPSASPGNQQAPSQSPAPPPPMPPVKTIPPGSAPSGDSNSREELFKLVVPVNFVLVPVTVKDNDGRMVPGLLSKDFEVLEDGTKQTLKFFTSDPFPLSAALIVDLGMPDSAVQKVNRTFPALQGAFSQFDQVALYSFSSTVSQLSDFSAVNQKLTATLNQLKVDRGRNNGPPVTSGPLASGPTVNGIPIDQPVQPVVTPPKESRVLNDAVLRAALDLSKQERTRRKIIFIISDGREYGSKASYSDVLKVLLTNNITVYAVGVEAAALPVYGKLERMVHLPRMGYADILPKYVSATGGEVFNELSSSDVELAYAAAIGEARNQYTLGYTTRAIPSSRYRTIEVRVRRPDVKVYAKDGYYPLPPGR